MTLSSGSYIISFVFALGYLAITHNFNVYKYLQLGLILLAPLVNHILVGGFVESSIVILASFITPVIALTFVTRKTARLFFYLFIVVVLVGGVWELSTTPPATRLPGYVVTLFFTANLIFISIIIYMLIDGFLRKQEELRIELRQSLDTLRITQNQLIQAEKMASLGELTAGIAHEIQNPLNFVGNFAEVSVDIIQELNEERQRPVRDYDLEDSLMTNLTQNLQKIAHHGLRASNIVRGMLEHSRASTGQRAATDLNALADEYLTLAYHGIRAKDKTGSTDRFTAHHELIADPTVGLVSLVPQDMGRVLLNIFNNAFYATQTRAGLGEPGYHPAVTVRTERRGKQVMVHIGDNGMGMPEALQTKIFQPFFTTKPSGQGTGLGLSLAYDIITKGHNGTLTVVSTEGQGTTFTITIPG
ncbi:hypothetical protein J2I48_08830 [Fibrella sp. HMF5036]|uniref:histidine kinase n=2 Tax=Fibrella aquatilis TaxID=2817059 RepID=A0A939G5P4_9BACT|nr:hypothetical protein [Fibrella aquatilis]